MAEIDSRCVLRHRGFQRLGEIVFQRSETDGVPVAIVPLGGVPVAIPLRALQRELGIEDDSEDGRMLVRIVESLDFVMTLQPGDRLPTEVLSGEASWRSAPHHLAAARLRLRAGLLRWTEVADRPGDLGAALQAVAPLIGVEGGEAAAELMEALAFELSFIEASRELLLERVRLLGARLERLRREAAPGPFRDELGQAWRLALVALGKIAARFDAIEAQTGDIVIALRQAASLQTFLRSNRDWLHRSRLAWEPVLAGWDRGDTLTPAARRALVGATYRFLAQRFMTVQEWRLARDKRRALRAEMVYEW